MTCKNMEKYRKICKITVILQEIIEQLKCGKTRLFTGFSRNEVNCISYSQQRSHLISSVVSSLFLKKN